MSNNRSRNRSRGNSRARDKATISDPFRFEHKGREYELPSSSASVEDMTAGDLIDAVMDESDKGELRLAWKTLEAADPDPEVIEALRDMKIHKFANIIQKWFKAGRVDPGKSDSSSD